MKRYINMALLAILAGGCATQGGMRDVEGTAETNQKILKENEYRLHSLENSVNALNTQIAQLNNRVYEVRTRTGQKTSMTVVPIVPPEQKSTPASSAAPAQPHKPQGRVIDPAAKPYALTTGQTKPAQPAARQAPAKAAPTPVATAPATGSIGGQPETVGAPSGPLSSSDTDLALPPAELPVQLPASNHVTSFTAPANTGTVQPVTATPAAPEVPVPVMPVSDLSLPPEHPGLPPIGSTQQVATHPAAAPTTLVPGTSLKGEEAAYKAALNAARSGHTEEGIRLFRDFLQRYPNGRYTANADYWIGECLYSQGKYQDALSQFQTVNNSFPKHHKNADALLKAGITMSRMGDKAGAQEKFKTLLQTFPNSDAAKRARAMGGGN